LRSWKFWIGLLVSIVFLTVALRGLDLEHFWQTLRGANYWWIVPSVGVYFVATWLRTWRWRYMLNHIKRIPVARLFPVVVIGYMGNNVYPARAGEVLRSYVLRRKEHIPISVSLTTVLLERLFDGLVMLLFILATLPFAPLPAIYRTLVLIMSALFGVALVVFLFVVARPARFEWLYTWLVDHLLPRMLRPHVRDLFDRFVEGLQALRSPRDVVLIFSISALTWLVEAASYWLVLQAFPFSVSLAVILLLTAVVNLFTTIPSTPGHVGTFDAPGIAILVQFGFVRAIAAGFMLVLHVTLWLPITLLGAFYMLRESVSWSDIERAAQIKEAADPLSPQSPDAGAPTAQTRPAELDSDDVARGVPS